MSLSLASYLHWLVICLWLLSFLQLLEWVVVEEFTFLFSSHPSIHPITYHWKHILQVKPARLHLFFFLKKHWLFKTIYIIWLLPNFKVHNIRIIFVKSNSANRGRPVRVLLLRHPNDTEPFIWNAWWAISEYEKCRSVFIYSPISWMGHTNIGGGPQAQWDSRRVCTHLLLHYSRPENRVKF